MSLNTPSYNRRLQIGTRVYVAVLGHGAVGSVFLDQMVQMRELVFQHTAIDLCVFAIADSRKLLICPKGADNAWREKLELCSPESNIYEQIVSYARLQEWEHLILVDNTASEEVARQYPYFVQGGFDLVSSNKRANTLPWADYQFLRLVLSSKERTYRYETNVGAGLPLIDNLKLLHLSGERIHRIYGLFSGSLSFIFNTLSEQPERSLRSIVEEAMELGYAEPDPREDLGGMDVARKVLILARELDIDLELTDVDLQSLIPEALREVSQEVFWAQFHLLEQEIARQRAACPEGHALRYIGEVLWSDQTQTAQLSAGLRAVPQHSVVGRLSGADCCFEIYTESYGDKPIVIQGAGAGTRVTARGVFGDVLRIAESY